MEKVQIDVKEKQPRLSTEQICFADEIVNIVKDFIYYFHRYIIFPAAPFIYMCERSFSMFELIIEFISKIPVLFGFLAGSGAFRKPLSAKEEAALLEEMAKGSMEARDTLIERNLRLVANVAKKYSQCGKEQDDLISIGTIGLIKALNTFRNDKGIRFATYGVRCIENEILMCLRAEKKLVNEVSINEPIGYDYEGNEINLIDVLSDEDESVFNEVNLKINTDILYKAIESELNDREKEIIELRYALISGKPKTQREIAKMLNISRSYVSRIEKKAIDKLAAVLKN